MSRTKEPQYESALELKESIGLERLGIMASQTWYEDPKRLTFVLARYKFVARLLHQGGNVLEVGCGDAFATRIVQQAGCNVTVIDFDPVFIKDIQERKSPKWPLRALVHDILKSPLEESFDAAYALDVLEHIPKEKEDLFMQNISRSVKSDATVIIGTPSLESQKYASPRSKAGHINCKSGEELRLLGKKFFKTVFMFSMNDEVVHTGFLPMAHYLFMVAAGIKKTPNRTPK